MRLISSAIGYLASASFFAWLILEAVGAHGSAIWLLSSFGLLVPTYLWLTRKPWKLNRRCMVCQQIFDRGTWGEGITDGIGPCCWHGYLSLNGLRRRPYPRA